MTRHAATPPGAAVPNVGASVGAAGGPRLDDRPGISAAPRLDPSRIIGRVEAALAGTEQGPWEGDDRMPPDGAAAAQLAFWQGVEGPDPWKREFVLSELLQPSDQAFVRTAYRAVLRRDPDEAGFAHYLHQLRRGDMSKVEILGTLRWAPEGKARSVHIDGLLAPYLFQKLRKAPLLGPIAAWVHAAARLGSLVQRQEASAAAAAYEAQTLGTTVNELSRQLQSRLERLEAAQARHVADDRQLEEQLGVHRAELAGHREQLHGHGEELAAHRSTIREQAVILAQMEQARTEALAGAHELDRLYADFEDKFRGSRELVRERAMPYLAFIRDAGAGTPNTPVLDLGCGRGEWLELLRDNGLAARGIENNEVFVGLCRERGLDVIQGDVIEVMGSMAEGSLGAISGMHIAEHLPFEVLVRLIDESLRLLRPGGLLFLETPNPENLQVATHFFYMDPTHRNPLPPEALQWIVQSRGFVQVQVERLAHARETPAMSFLDADLQGAGSVNALLSQMVAAPDYAVIARRAQT